MIQLGVPYRSQWADDADLNTADCGPTCVAMILNYFGVEATPNKLYDFLPDKKPGDYTSFVELARIAGKYDVKLDRQRPRNRKNALAVLREGIDQNRPVLVLVKYQPWQFKTKNIFKGGHFVVVTGYDDDTITFHDPLFREKDVDLSPGSHFKMSTDLFCAGWGGFHWTVNPNWACSIASSQRVAPEPVVITHPETPEEEPQQGDIPQDIDAVIKQRILALAAYRRAEPPNFEDPAETQPWLDHLGDFAAESERYTVASGDTFVGLAGRFYDSQRRWRAIREFNGLSSAFLWVGQPLRIPLVGETGAGETNDLPEDTLNIPGFLSLDDPAQQQAVDYNSVADASIGIGFVDDEEMDELGSLSTDESIATARSVIGFHYGPGGKKDGIGDFMRKLNDKKIPFFVKGIDDAGVCFEGQEIGNEKGVENWLIYRLSTAGQGHRYDYDVPLYERAPQEAAQIHWEVTVAKWPPELDKSKVWMEPINEPRAQVTDTQDQWDGLHPTDWLGRFMVEYAKIANREGFKVVGPSFNSGEPQVFVTNDYELPGMVEYLRYCSEHPDLAALSVHEYIWDAYKNGESWPNWYPTLFGRVEAAFAAADKHGIPRNFRVFMTEWGFAYQTAPRWPEVKQYLDAYNQWAARWPQVKGVAAWSLQSGFGGVDSDVVTWIKPLADYTINQTFDPGIQPAVTHARFGGTTPGVVPVTPTGPEGSGNQTGDKAEAAGFSANFPLEDQDLQPNQTFVASWTFKNRGETAWDRDYLLTYVDYDHSETADAVRAQFSPQTSYSIGEVGAPNGVAPGETITLSIPIMAPSEPGFFATTWRLKAPNETLFGPVRWVKGKVAPRPGSTVNPGTHDVQFVSFRNSVVGYEKMEPGRAFTGMWRIKNSGDVAWTGDYRLAFTPSTHPKTFGREVLNLADKPFFTLRELSGADRVNPGEEVALQFDFKSPADAGKYAFHWQLQTADGIPFGSLRWMTIAVHAVSVTPAPQPSPVQFGMNVNINDGHPLDAERLSGLEWVRWVFWSSRRRKTPQNAFNEYYKHVIDTYAAQGIRSLIVLHQDTEWANGPWGNDSNKDWDEYATRFGEVCGQVAAACAGYGDMVAYQIFNETDSGFGSQSGHDNTSAIGISPANYAKVLNAAAGAIKQADPNAKIIIGGMMTGPNDAIPYMQQVKDSLGGQLPVDAIAIHPYGRYVDFDPYYDKKFGTIGDALKQVKDAFPDLPIWITELGIAQDFELADEHYPAIARYMDEVIHEVAENQADLVDVFIWFGWSDLMRNAGVTKMNGEMKAHIGDVFEEMKKLG